MTHYNVAAELPDPAETEPPVELVALFIRCLLASTGITIAAWIILNAILDVV